MFSFFTCCGRTLQRDVSFEPLGLFDKTPGVCRFARLRPRMFALSFSAAPQTNTSVSSSAKVYGPCRTWEKSRFTVCWMRCRYLRRSFCFRHTILSCIVIRGVCYLDAERIHGGGGGGVLIQAGVGSKLLLCSPLPAIFLSVLGKAITLTSLAFDHFFFFFLYSRLKITDERANVCVGVCVGVGVRREGSR